MSADLIAEARSFGYNGSQLIGRLVAALEAAEAQLADAEVSDVFYRALHDGDKLWVESRNPHEVIRQSEGRSVTFERLAYLKSTKGWQPWTPDNATVPATEPIREGDA